MFGHGSAQESVSSEKKMLDSQKKDVESENESLDLEKEDRANEEGDTATEEGDTESESEDVESVKSKQNSSFMKKQRASKPRIKAIEYFKDINIGAEAIFDSLFFRMANSWLTQKSGLDLKNVVIGMCLFAATRTYSSKALEWLESNGTNTLNIPSHEILASDLELWVAQQPMNQQTLRYLCYLPSFQNMEWKNVAQSSNGTNDWDNGYHDNRGESSAEDEATGYDGYDFVASTGRSFFLFQGKLFALEKSKDSGDIKLRCFWGNAKPLQALIRHVQRALKNRGSMLQVHMIRGRLKETVTNKKRTLGSIDMAPKVKQDLLTDLQDFFDPETEEWCFENGAPYRKGYMFYGPPGTGKSSMCTAIASEFNLPLYYMHLADMDDQTLHEAFQVLPKRCMVLFEEIDTAGIVRHSTMKSGTDDPNSDDDSGAEDSHSKSPSKEQTKQNGKPKPQQSQVTLGGLLNVLDGPGAQEGRLVVFTTNSPNSLDEALIRPGRIDKKIYLGRSSKLVASITFSRIYGTDPRLKGKIRKQDLDRMAKEFGDLIPPNTFTPCEIQQYCMTKRGKPEQAISGLPKWIQDKQSGAQGFKYDIMQNPTGTDDEPEEDDEGWEEYLRSVASQKVGESSTGTSETQSNAVVGEVSEKECTLNLDALSVENSSRSSSISEPFYFSAPESPSKPGAFQRFNNLSHPDFAGLRNVHPHHQPLDDSASDLDHDRTMMLDVMHPLPDTLVLYHSEEEEETASEPETDPGLAYAKWSGSLFM